MLRTLRPAPHPAETPERCEHLLHLESLKCMARVFPLPFPPIPKLTNCLASDKHGSCALLCDGGLSVVMDVAAAVALDSCNVAITKVLNFGSAPSCACHCWSHDGFLYAICVGKTVHVTSSDRSFGIRALVHFLSDPRDICVSFLPDCSVIAVAAATARGIELCFDDSRPPLCLAPLSAAVCVDMVLIESDNRMVVAGVGTDGRACVWEVNLEGKAHAEVVFKSALPLTSQRPTHAKLCRKDGIISLVVATWDGGMFQGSSASLTAQQISPSGSAVEPSAEMISRSKAGHGPSLVYQNPNDFSMLVANSSSREICRIGSELTPIGCPSFEGTLVGFTCVSIRSSCECGTTRKFVVVATTTPHQLVTIPLDSLAATHPPILVTGGWEVSAEEATHDEKPHVRLVVRQSSTFDIVEPGLELTWVTASNDVGLVCCSDEPQSFWVVTSQACLQSQTFPGLLAALSSHMTSQQLLCTLVRLETDGALSVVKHDLFRTPPGFHFQTAPPLLCAFLVTNSTLESIVFETRCTFQLQWRLHIGLVFGASVFGVVDEK